jgi:hypothetical protein
MRLSLLIEREPFGKILESTMARYWSSVSNGPILVEWGDGRPECETWKGNIFLNFFCLPDVDPACFEIIRREFSHSRSLWRRGAQRAYVEAATRKPLRDLLSHVQFGVVGEVPDACEHLLVGGNRRMRLIHPAKGRSYVIHKHGYSKVGFLREVTARSGPAARVAPVFFGLDSSGTAFSEEYFVGTPANRFPPLEESMVRSNARELLVNEVHSVTHDEVLVSDYLAQLVQKIVTEVPLLKEDVESLQNWLLSMAGEGTVGKVFSHGDFQDANILVSGDRIQIIDWENSTERSQFYDLATMDSRIRMYGDRFNVWKNFISRWIEGELRVEHMLTPVDGKIQKIAHAAIWWLEEIMFQIDDLNASSYTNKEGSIPELKESVRRSQQYLKLLI